MRRSELLGLKWSDVDSEVGHLSVTRTIHRLRDRSFDIRSPKTKKGRRLISIVPSNTQILKRHKKTQGAQRKLLGITLKEEDLVFSKENGTPLLPDTVSNAWRRLAKSVGLKNIHLHSARHSMTAGLIKMGVHLTTVQERLGHEDIQTTADIYGHLLPGLAEAAAAQLDVWIKPRKQKDSDEIVPNQVNDGEIPT